MTATDASSSLAFGQDAPTARGPKLRIWIDTDVGSDVDDALAIAYALRHPDLELVGLSTVFGDVALRTRIARALLEIGGAADVPVVPGLGAPLTSGRAGLMFGHEGLGLLDDPAPRRTTESDPDGPARIDALARALDAARPDVLVAIGPMTNLGALARAGHALPALTVMGGKVEDVTLPGMVPQIPEWNWWNDPDAVASVLGAEAVAPPRIVPIEVTYRTRLAEHDLARLAEGDALARALGRLCGHWMTAQRERLGMSEGVVRLHDPLAVVTLVRPDLVPFSPARLRIDAQGATHRDPKGAPVEVATDVDNRALCAHLLEAWIA